MNRNIVFAGLFLLTACNSQAAATQSALPTGLPTAVAATHKPLATGPAGLPFEAATYTDVAAGIELQYPAGWFILGGEAGSRGEYVQIASWDPGPGGIQSVPEGESVLQIAIYQWDPQRDLDARLDMRRDAFINSGNTILEEDELDLGGARVVRLKLRLTDGTETLVYLAELGERYLELSGNGDLETLDAAMSTLRIDAPGQ
ncbi:MAG: hypothetical protein WD740_03465 [Anaerolineales bacterium]